MRPNFFIVGAARCGTSSLANYIGQHPDIFMSPIKEPYYFISNSHFDTENDYLSLFRNAKSQRYVGESSTGYLYSEESPMLIREFCPAAKIIVMLRNPIDMAFSLWKFMTVHGNESLSFEDALEEEAHRIAVGSAEVRAGRPENYFYSQRAQYFSQVKRYVDTFGVHSVKILVFEEFARNATQACIDVYDFLGVSSAFEASRSIINPGGAPRYRWLRKLRNQRYPVLKKLLPATARNAVRTFVRDMNVLPGEGPEMAAATREVLRLSFCDDVTQLRQLTGQAFSEWKDFSLGRPE